MSIDPSAAVWPRNCARMASAIRDRDWSDSPLGSLSNWPLRLRVLVDVVLESELPMLLAWGPARIQLYNDAFAELLGGVTQLGVALPSDWHLDWDIAQSPFADLEAGHSRTYEDRFRWTYREGSSKSSWYDLHFSPVLDEHSQLTGALLLVVDSTRRAMAEISGRNTQERLRALLVATPDAVFRVSADWRELLYLDGREFLIDVAEPHSDWLERLIPTDERARVRASIEQAASGRGLFELEHRIIKRDGTIGWASSRAIPIFTAGRRVNEWYGALSDISARKNAEEQLRASEARLAFLLKLSDAMRTIADGGELIHTTSELLGRHIKAGQVAYGEVDHAGEHLLITQDWNDGTIPSNAGRHRFEDFGECGTQVRTGEIVIVDDVRNDSRTAHTSSAIAAFRRVSVGAFVIVPLLRQGRIAAVLAIHTAEPRKWNSDAVLLAQEVADRLWLALERNRAEVALRQSERQFRLFGQASRDLLWIRDGHSLADGYVSPALQEIAGEPPAAMSESAAREGWTQSLHPTDRMHFFANLRRVQQGECLHHEYRLRRADGQLRWMQSYDFPILDEAGRLHQVAGIARDITDLKAHWDRTQLVITELNHRTRNLIALAKAIVNRAFRTAESAEEFQELVDRRLQSLARAAELLMQPDGQKTVAFDQLIRALLVGLGAESDNRIALSGSEGVRLSGAQTLTLTLALGELLTNAIKYGALSEPAGRLEVQWSVQVDYQRHLLVEWHESRTHPNNWARYGGGRELIEEALPYQLKAQTTYQLTATGLRCTISLPLGEPARESAHY